MSREAESCPLLPAVRGEQEELSVLVDDQRSRTNLESDLCSMKGSFSIIHCACTAKNHHTEELL